MPSNNEELDVTQPSNASEPKSKPKLKKPVKKAEADAPAKRLKSTAAEAKATEPVTAAVDDSFPMDGSEATPDNAKAAQPKSSESTSSAEGDGKTELTPKVTSTTSGEVPAPKPRDYKSIAIKVSAVVITLLALVVIIFGVLIYGYRSTSSVVYAVSGVIPYPAEKVNGTFVSYHSYLFEVNANERAYQNNAKLNNQPAVVFTTADGKKLVSQIKQHALDKLKQDAVTAQLASKNKVTVSQKEINDLLNELYSRYGGKATLLKSLKSIYGWNIDDLRSVIKKQLLAQKVQDKITSDPKTDAQAKAKAQGIASQLRGGADFATLAKQNSQASDASNGGDLGSFTRGQVPDEIQKAIDATAVGAVSDPVKTQYGYEVIKVISKDGDTFHVEHILSKTVDYTAYLNDQVAKAKVNTYIKI